MAGLGLRPDRLYFHGMDRERWLIGVSGFVGGSITGSNAHTHVNMSFKQVGQGYPSKGCDEVYV